MARRIKLACGRFAIVDDEDYQALRAHWWCGATRTVKYAFRHLPSYCDETGRRIRIIEWMHRRLMGLTPDDPREVDHINRNPLDNRKSNLRIATAQQNMFNKGSSKGPKSTSRYKGVAFMNGFWRASIVLNGKAIWLGMYRIEQEAALTYDWHARRLFGEYACPNFPDLQLDEPPKRMRHCALRREGGPVSGRKYKGVYPVRLRFQAVVCLGHKKYKYLGSFSTEEQAARAYDRAARQLLGPDAYQNFPDEHTPV